MIFVTVGTHEQPFDRLVKYMDSFKRESLPDEEVFIQTGYSTYIPEYCNWSRVIPYQEMEEKVNRARIVITHGGPASFILPLQNGKTPIVVPRQHQLGEHVNDHQVEFVRAVAERMGTIIPVYEIGRLGEVIHHYDELVKSGVQIQKSHNPEFNSMFEKIVKKMWQDHCDGR